MSTAVVQQRVVLTAHPLQRVGAYALACLAGIALPFCAASQSSKVRR